MKQNHNAIIEEAGLIAGGIYHQISVDGAGEIDGSVECVDCRISGACQIEGDVRFENVCDISGTAQIAGGVFGNRFSVSGVVQCASVSVKEMTCSDTLHVLGDVEAESLTIAGCCEIAGLLNAEFIRLTPAYRPDAGMDTTLHVGSIGCTSLSMAGAGCTLETDTIEGDDIQLTNTCCRIVRGNRIILGPGCQIERVEYTESCLCDESAQVTEQIQC